MKGKEKGLKKSREKKPNKNKYKNSAMKKYQKEFKNNYKKLKRKILFQMAMIVIFTAVLGVFILNIFVDGILQSSFANGMIQLMQHFNLSWDTANTLYGKLIMEYKNVYTFIGFVLLLLIFVNISVGRLTRYLDQIGYGIENILSDSEEPIDLQGGLEPIEEKLNTIKSTLKRREYEAGESEQRKNDLVAYLAHDLKTPLTSIIAYLSILDEKTDMSDEERKKYIHISLDKANRLDDLVNEFFEITTFNLQDIVIEKGRINLTMMLEQLADESYAVLAKKNMTCTLEADEGLIIDGDPDKLIRVFDNLLRNAVSYSDPDTNISIQAIEKTSMIEITFVNQGKQIPGHQLSTIFWKFYRVDNARSSQTGGAGLGLAIAKQIVDLHGGNIEAASDELSTRFIVRLKNANYVTKSARDVNDKGQPISKRSITRKQSVTKKQSLFKR